MAARRDAKALLEMLFDDDEAVRHKAFLALGSTSRSDRAWVPDLIEGLSNERHGVRVCAADALGGIGPPAAEAVPALVTLLSDPRSHPRQAAARALQQIGPAARPAAVPALARMLREDGEPDCREAAVRALGTFGERDAHAAAPIADALDDPDERVRDQAMNTLVRLGVNARDVLPALRRRVEREHDLPEPSRSQAARAVAAIMRGDRPSRSDEPYRSIASAAERGRFSDEAVAERARELLDQDDYEGALQLLESAAGGEQEPLFWVEMHCGAREVELPVAGRYHERYLETSGLGGFRHELERAVHSDRAPGKALRRMIGYCERVAPDPGWKPLRKLPVDEDLVRLEQWLRTALTETPPPEAVSGLWFGIVTLDRGDGSELDLYLSGGQPDEEEPSDRVIGGTWQPPALYAGSHVLREISRLAAGEAPQDAEYRLALSYAGLAVRWLATTLPPELLLGGAPDRVVAAGFEDGDSIGVGTVRPDGLAFPRRTRRRAA